MVKTRKKFFIVIERDKSKPEKLLFNVNFFYLRSYDPRSDSFSFIDKPFFRGTVQLGLDMNDKLRPLRFVKLRKDKTKKPINPGIFKKFLFDEHNKFIAFSRATNKQDLSSMLEMLNHFQFEKERIKYLTFCQRCLDKRRFKILDKQVQIKSFNDQIICSKCAMKIVKRKAELSGFLPAKKDSIRKLKGFLQHMILKFKDIKKVLEAFKPDFQPAENRDVTLYDMEKKTPISKKYMNVKVEELPISDPLERVLRKENIKTLLPIQAISIDQGLISERQDQLVMAPTSGGKTLVGEIAGIMNVLKSEGKMLYLVPIVALANIRTSEFKEKYSPIHMKVVKKTGESFLDPEPMKSSLSDITDADIVIATYEAIDYILRSGNYRFLGEIGTIVIDEVQTLIDQDRGFILDGLISRLKYLHQDAQFLYLSATVGEPEDLAEELHCNLIRYNNRPVPVERHLVLCLNESMKHKTIANLARKAYYQKSNYGFKGQSIVFSNARKKCEALAKYLNERGLFFRAYHGGLTNTERKRIEREFQDQKIAGVVTTAALAAGVDLPASQVIFESLAMGIDWLTVAEFEQMLGRAGRLRKHDLGRAYLLVEPGKIYSPKMKNTEETIAIRLLAGNIKDFELTPDQTKSNTELLSFISMFDEGVSHRSIRSFYNHLINGDYNIDASLKKLKSQNLIRIKKGSQYYATNLGRSIAKSFLTIRESLDIIDLIRDEENTITEISLELKPLKNVYLSKGMVADLAKNVNMKYMSNNFFSASVLNLMNAENVRKRKKFSRKFIRFVTRWMDDIFTCDCEDKPYCDCGRINLESIILDLRTKDNFSISEICMYLHEKYNLTVFKGDIIDYLNSLIYSFQSIKNIALGIPDLGEAYEAEIKKIPKIVQSIKT
ncbi:MAG: DEAD/DEAH box helicase [Promethearchaeia archaeon]